MCLPGHGAGTSRHTYGVKFARRSNHGAPSASWLLQNMAVPELTDGNNTHFMRTINSSRSELCKPTHLEPTSAHCANLALCSQTFVAPASITSLNHQTMPQRYQVGGVTGIFFLRSHNSMQENEFNFTRELFVLTDFFVQISVPRSPNPIYENKLKFTTGCIARTRAFHSERSLGALQSHDDNDAGRNIERARNANDGTGRCSDARTCSNSRRTLFKCFLELRKPMHPELMSTHHANRALC
jgi:hypothetical protein